MAWAGRWSGWPTRSSSSRRPTSRCRPRRSAGSKNAASTGPSHVVHLLSSLAEAYLVVIFVRVILSWFPISPGSAMASIYNIVYNVTEPVLGPIRRVMPSVGFGGMGLDLSPIILLLGLQLII